MSFIWPIMLLALLVIPLFVALYLRTQRRRRRIAAQYGSFGFAQARGKQLGKRRHIPPALFLVGLTVLLFALARPQAALSLPRLQGTVILAFDASGSMAATDLQPTRMEAAKAAARTFVQNQPSTVKVGVVSFSDSGFSVQAPTNDQAEIITAIDRLAPQRGTSLGAGIEAALNTIDAAKANGPLQYSDRAPTPEPVAPASDKSTVIVLLTDGENNIRPDPRDAAKAAADRGIRVYTVGVGSPMGADLQVDGFTVHTQLDEELLQQVAQQTGAAYFNAASPDDLASIYKQINLELVVEPEATELTALFAGIGILALLIGGVCSMLWFSRVP